LIRIESAAAEEGVTVHGGEGAGEGIGHRDVGNGPGFE